tara:strand:- start:58 stop:312 length:255 start_codon:yes stop_codon:yes gene_type:complete
MEDYMQKKKGGHTSTYEFLNKDVRNSHKELVERNSKMTPQELDMVEKFEDVPESLSNRDKDIGKVNKISTSTIQHMRGGSTFEE